MEPEKAGTALDLAYVELREVIERTMGSPAQEVNPLCEHYKFGATLIALLPNGGMFKDEKEKAGIDANIDVLKETHDAIAAKYQLTTIGDGPQLAAGGVWVIYIGFETEYARSHRWV